MKAMCLLVALATDRCSRIAILPVLEIGCASGVTLALKETLLAAIGWTQALGA